MHSIASVTKIILVNGNLPLKFTHDLAIILDKTHLSYYLAHESWYEKTEYLEEKRAKCSKLFPMKLTVRTLPPTENISRRETPTAARNSLHNNKSNIVELTYVFKKIQTLCLGFTAVNSTNATTTKNGPACESLQPLDILNTALDWNVLLLNMVTERNLTECEGNSSEVYHALQFGRRVYFTTLRYPLSKKIKLIRMLQDCNLH
jgi:hypothetical protein